MKHVLHRHCMPLVGVLLLTLVVTAKINAQDSTVIPLPDDVMVTSDLSDYAPRSTAVFRGSGFAPFESVVLKVKNLNRPCNTVSSDSSYLPWTVQASSDGSFVTQWTVCDCAGDSLKLKATGQTSGLIAYTSFTDAGSVTVNGTQSIIADRAANATAPLFTALGNIVVNENFSFSTGTGNNDFQTSLSQIVLTAPGGWEFNTSGVMVSRTGTNDNDRDISSISLASVTASTITINLTVNGTDDDDQITISGVQIRSTNGAVLPNSGVITFSFEGGIEGLTSPLNIVNLTQTVGNASKLAFTTQPGGASAGAVFTQQPVVQSQDQFGNPSTVNLGSNKTVTITLSSGTGALSGTTGLNIGTSIFGGGNGTVTYTNLQINSAGSKVLTASASGLTAAISNSFTVNAYQSTATDNFRTKSPGNWNSTATWESQPSGSGSTWYDATLTPTNTAGTIAVGHIVTVTADVTIDQATINAGGQVIVNSGITLTVNDGTGTDLISNGTLSVNGTLDNQGAITSTAATALFNANSNYKHSQNDGVIPVATWDANSTCQITGVVGTYPTGFNQSFGNITWDCAGQTTTGSFIASGIVAINGNLTVQNTGTGDFRWQDNPLTIGGDLNISGGTTVIAGAAAKVLNVSGDVNITNGTLVINQGSSGTLNVTGNLIQSGGNFNFRNNTSGTATATVSGDFSLSAGTMNMSGASAVGTLNVAGDFSHTGGSVITETSSGSGSIIFNGSTVQTYTSGGTITNTINFTVNSGATLQMAEENTVITGGGSFTLSPGATLGIRAIDGITTSGATGHIRVTGTRSYSTGASYIYNNTASSQNTGNGLPGTVNTLTIDNTGNALPGVSLTNSVSAATLNLTHGLLTTNANTVTVTGTINDADASSYVNGKLAQPITGTGSKIYPTGKAISYPGVYKPVTFTYTTNSGTKTVTIEQFEAAYPTTIPATVSVARFETRYWNIAQSATGAGYKVSLDGGAASLTGTGVMIRREDGGAANSNPAIFSAPDYTNTNAFTTTNASNDLALGETNIPLTITGITAENKIYDGSTTASFTGTAALNGIVGSDAVTLNSTAATGAFPDKNVGLGKPVTASGFTLNGVNAEAYSLTQPTGLTADITTRDINVTAQTDSRIYNGTTSSAVNPVVDALETGDAIDTDPIQVYDTKNVGTGKTLSASGLVINDGNGGNNYSVHYVDNNTGVISAKDINVTAQTDSRIYNGTTISAIDPVIDALETGDAVFTAPTQVYDNKNVGSGKTLSAGGLVINDGNGGNNYTVHYLDNTTGLISAKEINVTAQTDSRTYNGTTSSAVNPVVGALETGDAVFTAPTQVYDNKNVGTGKTLSASGLVINDGNGGNNYSVHYVDNNTGLISAKDINVTAQTDSRIYNGTTSSAVNPVVGALETGDAIATDPTQSYDTRNVGTGKTLSASGLVINDGNGGNNYAVHYVDNNTGVIAAKDINVTAQTDSRIYNGTTSSTVNPVVDAIETGDAIDTDPIQVYDTKNVGTGKTLSASGLVINDGNGGNNYAVHYVDNNTGVISARPITITADAKSKTWGDADPPLTYQVTSGSLVADDAITGTLTRVPGESAIGNPSLYEIQQGSVAISNNYAILYIIDYLSIYPRPIVASAIAGSIACNGGTTSITVTASGGDGTPLMYKLNDGAYQNSNVFTDVPASATPYVVTVKDPEGFTTTTNPVIVTQPAVLSASVTNENGGTILNRHLYYGYAGDQSTKIKVSPTGGTAPYTVKITMNRKIICNAINAAGDEAWISTASGGAIKQDINTVCGIAPSIGDTGTIASNIGTNGYLMVTATLLDTAIITYTVTDKNGCSYTYSDSIFSEDARCFAGKDNKITKVQLCHRTGSEKNPCVTICVDENAVADHIAHGDSFGACPKTGCGLSYNNQSPVRGTTLDEVSDKLQVKIMPNPSVRGVPFILTAKGKTTEEIEIRVVNIVGQEVYRTRGAINNTYRFGSEFMSGAYFVQVMQGKSVQTIKILKQ